MAKETEPKFRHEWEFLGRILGTCTGWDGEIDAFTLHDFQPAPEIKMESGDVNVDITKGLMEVFDSDGTMIGRCQINFLIETLP